MKIKDKVKAKLPPLEPGVYVANCIGVVDLGEQYSKQYGYSNKILFVFELPSETVEVDGQQMPRQLSQSFTWSGSNRSKLRKTLQVWNTKTYSDDEFSELDLFDQLGKPCQLTVVLNETKEYSNIESVMALPKGYPAPHTATEFIKWDMDSWDDDLLQRLPEWVRWKIQQSTQYQKLHAPDTSIEVEDQDNQTEECPI